MLAIVCGMNGATEACLPNLDEPEELMVKGGWQDPPCFAGEENSGECLLGPNWSEYRTTALYEQLPDEPDVFYKVFRPLVGKDPIRDLIQIRFVLALVGSIFLALAVVLAGSHGSDLLLMWFAVGAPVAMLHTNTVTDTALTLLSLPALVTALFFVFSRDSQRLRQVGWIVGGAAILTLLVNSSAGIVTLVVFISAISFLLGGVSFLGSSMVVDGLPQDEVKVSPSTRLRSRIRFGSPFVFWSSVVVLILANFRHDLWRKVFMGLVPQVHDLRIVRTILRVPNFTLGFIGAGQWKLGYADLPVPVLATFCSFIVVGLVLFHWVEQTIKTSRIRWYVLLGVLAAAIVFAHEKRNLEIGGDLAEPVRFLPYFSGLMLMVPLLYSRPLGKRTASCIRSLAVIGIGAALWGTMRRYVTGFPGTPTTEGPCLICGLSPQSWWWNHWYKFVLGPVSTWSIAVLSVSIAILAARSLSSDLTLKKKWASRRTAAITILILVLALISLVMPWLIEFAQPNWAR
jgi:hypothetical protein